MAGTKGKIGGRNKSVKVVTRVCERCGAVGEIGTGVISVKIATSTGRSHMAFVCKDSDKCK